MKTHLFDSNVERIYCSLSADEKEKYKRQQDKFNKTFLIFGIVLAVLVLAAVVGSTIACIIGKEYSLLIFAVIILLLGGALVIWVIRSSAVALRANDEIKIKMHIERLEKQKEQLANQTEAKLKADLQKNVYYRLSVDKIKSVAIIDSYTEYSDKLHAVLNYREIIQTRVYKFKVNYIDGTSKVITAAEGSEEYSILITHVNSSTENQAEMPNNNIGKLREYKKLLDDGIITQEEFDAKKKELLP